MIKLYLKTLLLVSAAGLFLALPAGCSDNKSNGGGSDMGPTLDMACYMNPTTHDQLINACTTSQSYDKMPFYPARAPGGQLPPLP